MPALNPILFTELVARMIPDGECAACRKPAGSPNPECAEHAPFAMCAEDAVTTLNCLIETARAVPSGPEENQTLAELFADESDLGTVLSALRIFQDQYEGLDASEILKDWPDHFTRDDGTTIPPLSTEDIDDLCEQINVLSVRESL